MGPGEYLKMPYGRVVYPESDGTYRAEITEFPGCIAVGDTAGEALANLEDVALSWLEATLAKEQRVPDPVETVGFSGKLVVRLPKSLHKKAAYFAKFDGASLNQFIVSCIAEQVGSRTAQVRFAPIASLQRGLQSSIGITQYLPPSDVSAAFQPWGKIQAQKLAVSAPGVQFSDVFRPQMSPFMPEANQYVWSNRELLELLIKHADVRDGWWTLLMNFGVGTGGFGPSPDQTAPGIAISVSAVGIQRSTPDAPGPLNMNAAVVNPAKAST